MYRIVLDRRRGTTDPNKTDSAERATRSMFKCRKVILRDNYFGGTVSHGNTKGAWKGTRKLK
jgi:hypothetical protein